MGRGAVPVSRRGICPELLTEAFSFQQQDIHCLPHVTDTEPGTESSGVEGSEPACEDFQSSGPDGHQWASGVSCRSTGSS